MYARRGGGLEVSGRRRPRTRSEVAVVDDRVGPCRAPTSEGLVEERPVASAPGFAFSLLAVFTNCSLSQRSRLTSRVRGVAVDEAVCASRPDRRPARSTPGCLVIAELAAATRVRSQAEGGLPQDRGCSTLSTSGLAAASGGAGALHVAFEPPPPPLLASLLRAGGSSPTWRSSFGAPGCRARRELAQLAADSRSRSAAGGSPRAEARRRHTSGPEKMV